MDSGELLSIHPQELRFPFELNKQSPCTMQVTSNTDSHVAFKVKTTNPKNYSVRPNTGIVLPHSTHELIVTMQAQKEAPADLQCKDRFLLQSVVISPEITIKDITSNMFSRELGNVVDECKLKVSYFEPPQLSSTVQGGSEDISSPRVSFSDDGPSNTSFAAPRSHVDHDDDSSQTTALISRLTEEKNSTTQQNNKLHQEMMMVQEQLRREISRKRHGVIPYAYLIIVALIGVLVGYIVKKT